MFVRCSLFDFNNINCGSNLKTAEPTQHNLKWDHANTFEFLNRTLIDSDYTVKILNVLPVNLIKALF